MAIFLLDDTVKIEIYYDPEDCGFEDNICLTIWEDCPEEEKIFIAEETNIFLTPEQAYQLAMALSNATVAGNSAPKQT